MSVVYTENEILDQTRTELSLGKGWAIDLISNPNIKLKNSPNPGELDLEKAADYLPRTELIAAKAIASKFQNRLTYVNADKTWYLWDGKIHRPCVGDAVALKVINDLFDAEVLALDWIKGRIENLAMGIAAAGTGDAKADAAKMRKTYDTVWGKHRTFRDNLATDRTMKAVVNIMKRLMDVTDDHYASHNEEADDRRYFVINNGVYDMEAVRRDRRFDLLPHDPSRAVYRMWNLTEEVGTDYPELKYFLSTSIADTSQSVFFSKAVALACMGAPTTTRIIVSVQGARRSGKSMINRILTTVGGKESGFVEEPDRAAIVANAGKKTHARYPMRHARYIGFTEIVDELDREFVLKYTGGDKYEVEQKYVAATQVYPQGVIFMASNHAVNVDKTDEAMFERVSPIYFPNTYDGLENTEDKDLQKKIEANRAGFLEWMKWSYLEYLEKGLDKSDSMEALKLAEREDEYSVMQYIKDRSESGLLKTDYEADVKDCVSVVDLFKNYLAWCKDLDVPASKRLKRKEFSIEVSRKYPKESYQKVHFHGLVENASSYNRF